MDTEQILTYIGMAVVVIFAIYYVLKMGSVQARVIEGLTSKKTNTSALDTMATGDVKVLKSAVEKMSDGWLIDKYRSNYEDMLMDLEKLVDYTILEGLIHSSASIQESGTIDMSDKTTGFGKAVPILNELYTLKANLNSTMDFLDSTSSSKTAATSSAPATSKTSSSW